MNPKAAFGLLKQTYTEWSEDKAPRLAAALAYYTVFSLAPLLVIVIAIVSLVYANAGQMISQQIAGVVGQQAAGAIQQMIAGTGKQSSSIIATIVGFATLLLTASGLFGQLQDALNTIWEVQPKPDQGIIATLKQRFLSFTMVLGTGFLLLVSLVVSTALVAITGYLQRLLPGIDIFWSVVNFIISVGITTVIFALIYKVIPDAKIAWGDVGIGAFATAILFTLGQLLIGLYLGRSTTNSTYGAAGSFVILLLWVYYSAQILFFGAEFTQVYATTYGSRIQPAANAVALSEKARIQQGIPRQADVKAAAQRTGQSVEGVSKQRQAAAQRATSGSNGSTKAGTAKGRAVTAQPAPKGPMSAVIGFFAGMLIGMRRGSRHR